MTDENEEKGEGGGEGETVRRCIDCGAVLQARPRGRPVRCKDCGRARKLRRWRERYRRDTVRRKTDDADIARKARNSAAYELRKRRERAAAGSAACVLGIVVGTVGGGRVRVLLLDGTDWVASARVGAKWSTRDRVGDGDYVWLEQARVPGGGKLAENRRVARLAAEIFKHRAECMLLCDAARRYMAAEADADEREYDLSGGLFPLMFKKLKTPELHALSEARRIERGERS